MIPVRERSNPLFIVQVWSTGISSNTASSNHLTSLYSLSNLDSSAPKVRVHVPNPSALVPRIDNYVEAICVAISSPANMNNLSSACGMDWGTHRGAVVNTSVITGSP